MPPPDAGPDPGLPTDGDLQAVTNLLLYGSAAARRRLAEALVAGRDRHVWQLLAATVTGSEPWQLRARCLEVVGLMAGCSEQGLAEQILAIVCRQEKPGG